MINLAKDSSIINTIIMGNIDEHIPTKTIRDNSSTTNRRIGNPTIRLSIINRRMRQPTAIIIDKTIVDSGS